MICSNIYSLSCPETINIKNRIFVCDDIVYTIENKILYVMGIRQGVVTDLQEIRKESKTQLIIEVNDKIIYRLNNISNDTN